MAIYRNIELGFWDDPKVEDDFTPEDKFFFLFVLTNPYTNLSGCYEISMKQMARKTGYTEDTIKHLINRMENVHKVIRYCNETKEMLILNWYKHNWTKSEKLDKPILSQIEAVKNAEFKAYLVDLYNKRDTVSIPYTYPMDTTVSVYIKENNISNSIKEIIDYLNLKTDSKYTCKNKSCNSKIKARLDEGHTVEDFKKVIDIKTAEWQGNEMEKYLRPDTLFGNKFEGYLNQKEVKNGNIRENNNGNTEDISENERISRRYIYGG